MDESIHVRDNTEGLTHVRKDDPTTDPVLAPRVREGDIWINLNNFGLFLRQNDAWIQKNHWQEIDGKPFFFTPEPHPLSPEEGFHLGDLDIEHVAGHDLSVPPHRELFMLSIMRRSKFFA